MSWLLFFLLILVCYTYLVLRGPDLSYLDNTVVPQPDREPSEEHAVVVEQISGMSALAQQAKGRDRLTRMREFMDGMSDGKEFASEFIPQPGPGVKGEWVLAPGSDPRRRILYIHGGAWIAGSPRSHRAITDRLSQLAGAAVFSLDYRLMPEHRRIGGIEDCRSAYRWILENGPQGKEALDFLMVAGDSAGGNLTLITIAWARDEGLRAADAVVAFSPATDGTLSSPSSINNIPTDPLLGPGFGMLGKVPKPVLWWASYVYTRIRPSDPRVSPLHGDLSGLPPVLVQASECEMLFDDARRYVAKAEQAGSPVQLQSWPHMVHVWQIFADSLPEAEEAYRNIGEFLAAIEQPAEDIAA